MNQDTNSETDIAEDEARHAYDHALFCMNSGHSLPPAVLACGILISQALVVAANLIARAIVRIK